MTQLTLAFTAAIGFGFRHRTTSVVNSEKVFKSIDEYNKALDTLDQLAKSYQQQVDLKFEEVEALYNNYKAQEMSLSASSRQARQNLILTREEEASKFQEEIFGQDGTLMKTDRADPADPETGIRRHCELCRTNGYELVLDAASNPTPALQFRKIDHTQALIEL